MNDYYSHEDSRVLYVVENIPGPSPRQHSDEYNELMDKFNSQLTEFCTCEQGCAHSDCNCLKISGGPSYTKNGLKHVLSQKDFKTQPIMECNSLCTCLDNCGNRLVQNGPIEGLIVKTCSYKTKGMGLFTTQPIHKGTFICEYAGELITKSEALKRHKSNTLQGKMNFIYCLNEHSNGGITQTFIDPSTFGNIGRYINHSCESNSQIIPVRVDSPIPKLAIFSCQDILTNTEITFDYGSFDNKEISDINSKIRTEDVDDRKKCLCSSQKCKGLMPYDVY